MSKLKVGDRVRFVTATPVDVQTIAKKVGEIAEVVEVKRPNPAAPDRVMVAARLLAGMLANPSGPIQSNEQSGWDYVNCSAESLSQVALDLADALIAEGAK